MKIKITSLLALFLIFATGCSVEDEIKIAISRGSGSPGYENYEEWINSIDPDIKVIDMYGMDKDQAVRKLETCSGLILSGGPDVHPSNFGRGYDTLRCSIDSWRDTLEFSLIKKAKQLQMPVFGICRGLQILNVAYGGSLVVDIPEDTDSQVIHQDKEAEEDPMHTVNVVEETLLHKLSRVTTGKVNSNHHQAIDKLASSFQASAFTKDSIIEAIEYKSRINKPFLLAVQWHPERLPINDKLSRPLVNKFLLEADKFKKQEK